MNVTVRLRSRNWIGIRGVDSLKFLQPLISQNLELLTNSKNDNQLLNENAIAIPSLFLKSTGRIQFESIIIKPNLSEEFSSKSFFNFDYIIDHDRRLTSELLQLLTKRKLRSQITVEDLTSELSALQILPKSFIGHETEKTSKIFPMEIPQGLYFKDPRWPNLLGRRLIYEKLNGVEFSEIQTEQLILYDEYRLKHSVLEPDDFLTVKNQLGNQINQQCLSELISTHLPFNVNYDFLGYLNNSNKGCYVGQEIMALSLTSPTIRRRLIGIQAERPLPIGTQLIVIAETQNELKSLKFEKIVGIRGSIILCIINLKDFARWIEKHGGP